MILQTQLGIVAYLSIHFDELNNFCLKALSKLSSVRLYLLVFCISLQNDMFEGEASYFLLVSD
jgi:hypothetical protein